MVFVGSLLVNFFRLNCIGDIQVPSSPTKAQFNVSFARSILVESFGLLVELALKTKQNEPPSTIFTLFLPCA